MFRRSAGPRPSVAESAVCMPSPAWRPIDPITHSQRPAPTTPLSANAARFWCEHADAIRDLGLPCTTTPADLRSAAACSPAHVFRSHEAADTTLWSLYSAPHDGTPHHVLLVNWRSVVRSPTAMRHLHTTISDHVGQGASVRCPMCSGVPHHLFAAFGLRPRGLSPTGRSACLRRDPADIRPLRRPDVPRSASSPYTPQRVTHQGA